MRLALAFICVIAVATAALAAGGGADGKALYLQRCAFCHGTSGRGNGPASSSLKPRPTNFTDASLWNATKPEQLKEMIAKGKPGTSMVPFGKTLSPVQIDALVDYLKTFAPGARK